MNGLKSYYAHSINLYNSIQEKEDLESLKNLGFEVINPNSEEHSEGYEKKGMEYFYKVLKNCNVVFFRSNPDGTINAGISKELEYALRLKLPIFELPCMLSKRSLTIEQTREYLKNSGRGYF